ncbi:hypothetical protein C2S52_004491 [Perilla frutescens var. hirtella]|nr:hypothetical protein C2S52_004491 [Perilla frutescens var. hirtella]
MSTSKPHIYFLPMMAPGHMIPMIDIARKFSRHGAKSTIITTSSNASQFSQTIQRDEANGFPISISLVEFPCREAGLPDGCENLSSTTTTEMSLNFLKALDLLQQPVEQILAEGRPDCIIVGAFFWWTTAIASNLKIPRIAFYGTGFFPMCIFRCLRDHRPHEKVASDSEEFLLSCLPNELTVSRRQIPEHFKQDDDKNPLAELTRKVLAADEAGCGIIVNTFYELEPAYADHYRKMIGNKAWHIGPVSLINETNEDKTQRGQEANQDCLSWLGSKKPNSVVYVCFGSMSIFQKPQLHEIAGALESSGQEFIWVVGKKTKEEESIDHLPEGFEERTKGRGLIIRGWAPQVQILDHEAVGGFVTHCGWNSLLEGVAAGVPMVTWPLSAEQFFNEKLLAEILRTGIPVGAEEWAKRTDERVAIGCERIEKAVVELMVGEEGERIRNRARNLGDVAKRAVQEGGSSYTDFNCLMEEIRMFHSS